MIWSYHGKHIIPGSLLRDYFNIQHILLHFVLPHKHKTLKVYFFMYPMATLWWMQSEFSYYIFKQLTIWKYSMSFHGNHWIKLTTASLLKSKSWTKRLLLKDWGEMCQEVHKPALYMGQFQNTLAFNLKTNNLYIGFWMNGFPSM